MRKFAGSLMPFLLVFFLCTSNLWAGDSEIRIEPGDQESQALPLTIPGDELIREDMTKAKPAPAAAEKKEVKTEPAPQAEMDQASEAVKAETAEQAPAAMETPAAEQAAAVQPPPPAPKDDLTIAAELIDKKGLENYKKALELCEAAVQKDPDSFKANWMAAEACRKYGMEAQELGLSDWKDICKLYGKKGMAYAEKAIQLNPKAVNGYFWYGMDVGIYADSVSILTALKEGLKDKTQNSFEKAYEIDKNYEGGGPIAALGRFWAVLPWPLNDDDKAMNYYREFQKTPYFGTPDHVEVNVYFAELLMDSRSTKDEAIQMLKQVPRISKNKYWNDQAKKLLDEM